MKAPVVVLSEMSFSASSFKGKMSFRDGEVEDSISVAASAVVSSALIGSPSLYKRLICGFVQGVPTSLGYAKCNFLSEASYLQKRPNKKGEISNFNDVTGSKFKISPFLSGQNSPFFMGSKFKIPPFYRDKIQNLPLFIGSFFL